MAATSLASPAPEMARPLPDSSAASPLSGVLARVAAYAETTKFRSVPLLTLGAVVGGAAGLAALGSGALAGSVTVGGGPAIAASWSRLGWSLLAVALGCMGANAITGYIDRRMDGVMERTRHRPLPTGRLYPIEVLGFGLLLCALGFSVALLAAGPWAAFWLAFGVFDSAGVYNGLAKPRTSLNVILGSPAGGAPVMVGWAAATGTPFGWVAFLTAAVVVAWTPVHIWSLAIRHVDDYRRAGVPMLPVVIGVKKAARCVGAASLSLCAVATALALVAGFNSVALVITIGLQAPIVVESLAVMREPAPLRARRLFKLTGPYLAAVFALVIWQSLSH